MLIQHLPPESATRTALRLAVPLEDRYVQDAVERDPEAGSWSQDQMLLAQIIDVLRAQHYSFLKANGAKGIEPPPQVPRPGVAPAVPRRPAALSADNADLLFQLINGPPAESG
ncbi:hypothetical protein ACIQC7_27980 [Kitasatospora sp. NPDC088556]|uniref:hypothetical protein n=1 Tax=Kitasatospora sp. NPDC088556 TaxID=3364076 RepID=UPI00381BE0EA